MQQERKNLQRGIAAVILAGLATFGFAWNQSAEARCECERRMEAQLEKEFSFYTDAETVLEFDFGVDKQAQQVEVHLFGLNFDGDDTEWTQRVRPAFENFIGAVGETVAYEMQKPIVRMHIVGEDGDEITVYRFD